MDANHLIRMRQRRREKIKRGTPRRVGQLLTSVGIAMLVVLVAVPATVATAVSATYAYLTAGLPDPTQIQKVENDFQTTKIFDRNSNLLYEIIDPTGGDRQWVPINSISPYLRCATVAIEDKTFWENQGFDIRGTARAALANLRGESQQGGSGITQQLVKNVVLPIEERAGPGRTPVVKIKEVLLSAEVSRRYDKRTIFEWYLNTNFYGNLAYGIEAAAKVYFGKSAKDLDLSESAMLAAIPQFPGKNPFDSPVEAEDRQDLVLDLMVERTKFGVPGCNVKAEDAANAKRQNLLYVSKTQRFNIKAPHFSVYAKERAIELLADYRGIGMEAATQLVERGGLRIYTALDLAIDDQVRSFANQRIAAMQAENKNVNNASVVVIKAGTGEILSMVGSLDYFNDNIDGKFNVAMGLRQPGSSFKPITYLELLRQGNPPTTLFWDTRIQFPSGGAVPYVPENYDRKYHGPVLMRSALANSYNIPAVEALNQAGINNVIRLSHRMGINDLNRGLDFYGLALTLGGGEVRLLDMTYLYSVIANYGTMKGVPRPKDQKRPGFRELDPVAILRIERDDRDPQTGNQKTEILYDFQPAEVPNLVGPNSKQVTWQLIDIISDGRARAPGFGYPSALDLADGRPAAVKTGTTNDYKDNWTMGFTPDFVTGVWVGNTDSTPMDQGISGLTGAAPIWNDVMNFLHQGREIKEFVQPEGLEQKSVCRIDGLLPNGSCPTLADWFLPDTAPERQSTIVQQFPIDKASGKLAVAGTPPENVENKTFYVFPPQAQDWYSSLTDDQKAAFPVPPTDLATSVASGAVGDVVISFPSNGSYISPNLSQSAPAAASVVDPNNPNPAPPPEAVAPPPGIIQIRGNAKGGNYLSYRVAIAPGYSPSPEQWQQIGPDHPEQLDNGVLENWNLAGFGPGPYSIRLTRVEQDGTQTNAVIQVNIDNAAPSASMGLPLAGDLYSPSDEWVDVSANVNDDQSISRVEFYANGQKFGEKTSAPFDIKFTIGDNRGSLDFYTIAYDGAGNKTQSDLVRIAIGG